MDLGLKGKLALVTGSTQGLGRAIAEALAGEGCDVIINGRWSKTVGNTAYEIEHKFGHSIRVHQFTCDVTDSKRIKELFSEQISKLGKLDILINNVGDREKFGTLTDLKYEDWKQSFDLVLMSTNCFIEEALPYLEKSECGRIINISTLVSHQPGNFNPHYSTMKAAVNNLTKHLANTLASKNILVNVICPTTLLGGGWTKNIQEIAKKDGLTFEEVEQRTIQAESKKSPLGRMGTLEDVANLVAFLVSDKAKFLTGHVYNVDGGITKSV